MGHLIWNRIIDGKRTPSKATNILLTHKKDIYIIACKNSNCDAPMVLKASKNICETIGGHICCTPNAGVFMLRTQYGDAIPGTIFPLKFNKFFVNNKQLVLNMSGDYTNENDDDLSGFIAEQYGTIDNPLSAEFDTWNRTTGWCSIWWTDDKKEANTMLALIKKSRM